MEVIQIIFGEKKGKFEFIPPFTHSVGMKESLEKMSGESLGNLCSLPMIY